MLTLMEIFLFVTSCEAPSVLCGSGCDFREESSVLLNSTSLTVLLQKWIPKLVILRRTSQGCLGAVGTLAAPTAGPHSRGSCWDDIATACDTQKASAASPCWTSCVWPLCNPAESGCLPKVSGLSTDSLGLAHDSPDLQLLGLSIA